MGLNGVIWIGQQLAFWLRSHSALSFGMACLGCKFDVHPLLHPQSNVNVQTQVELQGQHPHCLGS